MSGPAVSEAVGESSASGHDTVFVVLTSSTGEQIQAGVLIDSLREFGGSLANSPVWLIQGGEVLASRRLSGSGGPTLIPLSRARGARRYVFMSKVRACAQAERLAEREGFDSIVWLSSHSLIVSPPELFSLGRGTDAALRAVHISNVGSPADERPDRFWRGVYRSVGTQVPEHTVESMVDRVVLRPYYNTHLLSVRPSTGLLRSWLEHFMTLVTDDAFQRECCADTTHRIFLHQAVFSALVCRMLDPGSITALPGGYSYPLHLHEQIPREDRADRMNDLVVAVYDDYHGLPEAMQEMRVDEPLVSWLENSLGEKA